MAPDRYRYGPFDGGPDPLARPFDVRAALDDIGEEVLRGSNIADAVAQRRRRGAPGSPGLDDLLRQIRKRRKELQRSGRLSGALDQARAALDQALAAEREQLGREQSDAARLDEMTLDGLPNDTASAIRDLKDYPWHSEEAKRIYDSITENLRDEVLQQQFRGMKQALQDNPQARQQIADMLADLNQLLADHARGQDTLEQFESFMSKHGQFFPENPANVDELIDELARRQAAAQRMMRSLTREQRAELQDLIESAMGDADLDSQMAQLADNLNALRPGMMRGQGMRVDGEGELGYSDAVGVVDELADLQELAQQLSQDYPGATLDDVDIEALERQLGPSAARALAAQRDLENELIRQGYLARNHGRLELTPKALRRLGQTALSVILQRLGAQRGRHDMHETGHATEFTGAYLPWNVGEDRPIDAVRTVTNAVRRRAAGREGALVPDDFEVAETESVVTAAVALCVDLSFSMIQEDRWGPMKQTALALAHLVATRFRGDALQIIGFDRTARVLSPLQLAAVEPEWVQGTNLQHALLLAGRHLRRHPNAEPIVLVVTDGEPTAHLTETGESVFHWPSTPETIRATVTEVDVLARSGAVLNIFRLGDDPSLARFTDAIARRAGGRVFSPDTDRLGEFVVGDYVRMRRSPRR